MLKKLSIKGRMLLIIGGIAILFIILSYASWKTAHDVKNLGLSEAGEAMIEDQKAKVAVATQAAATLLGHALEDVRDHARQVEIIRRMIDDFRL